MPQPPAVLVCNRNAKVNCEQLIRCDPLLAADVRPRYAG
jgi:hypothetical protein